jgi:hypothetical protein
MNVAGQGCLSYVKASSCEFATQFVLAGDCSLYQQVLNRGMALLLHENVCTCSFALSSSTLIERKAVKLNYV